ncbi:MAG TPA: hypothetical protein VMJ65_20840 [Solirubrobacteraceae bacterium]|nr:hypothetical protein [Solirubrobacteraceae bacterium]
MDSGQLGFHRDHEIGAIKSPGWFDIVAAQWGIKHEASSPNAPIPS